VILKELRKELLQEIDKRLRPKGFRKRERSFRKEFGDCRWSFHVAFINHSDSFDVTADAAVRHHAVENELNADKPYLTETEKKHTYTIGAELGNIVGTGQHRWTVCGGDDIASVVQDIMLCFDKVGLPFLERFSSLEEVHSVLARDDSEAKLICPMPDVREKTRAVLEFMRTANGS